MRRRGSADRPRGLVRLGNVALSECVPEKDRSSLVTSVTSPKLLMKPCVPFSKSNTSCGATPGPPPVPPPPPAVVPPHNCRRRKGCRRQSCRRRKGCRRQSRRRRKWSSRQISHAKVPTAQHLISRHEARRPAGPCRAHSSTRPPHPSYLSEALDRDRRDLACVSHMRIACGGCHTFSTPAVQVFRVAAVPVRAMLGPPDPSPLSLPVGGQRHHESEKYTTRLFASIEYAYSGLPSARGSRAPLFHVRHVRACNRAWRLH